MTAAAGAVTITHPDKMLFPDDGITKARARRLLRRRRDGHAAAPAPAADHDGALPGRHRRERLPAEGRGQGLSRVADSASKPRRRAGRCTTDRQRSPLAAVAREPEHDHAARLALARAAHRQARHLRLRPRPVARRARGSARRGAGAARPAARARADELGEDVGVEGVSHRHAAEAGVDVRRVGGFRRLGRGGAGATEAEAPDARRSARPTAAGAS